MHIGNRTQRLLIKPERVFLIAASVLTLVYAHSVFPLTHYFHGTERVLQVVNYSMAAIGQPGKIPRGFLEIIKQSRPEQLTVKYPEQALQWDSELGRKHYFSSTDPHILGFRYKKKEKAFERFMRLKEIPLDLNRTVSFKTKGEPVFYPVIGFIPYIIPVIIGLLLHLPPVAILYMAMLFKGFLGVLIGYWIIRYIPIMKWSCVFILLIPSLCYMRLMPVTDDVCIKLIMVLLALVLHWMVHPSRLTTAQLIGVSGISVAIAMVKMAYFFIPAIVTMLPNGCFNSRRSKRYFITFIIFSSMLAAVIWVLYASWSGRVAAVIEPIAGTGWIPLQKVLGHISNIAAVTTNEMGVADNPLHILYTYLKSLFFWKGMPAPFMVPGWILCLGTFLLSLTSIAPWRDNNSLHVSRQHRYLATGLGIAVFGAVFIVTVGVGGWIQGRYFLPALPLLLLAMYNPMPNIVKYQSFLSPGFVVAAFIIWIEMHYYMFRILRII